MVAQLAGYFVANQLAANLQMAWPGPDHNARDVQRRRRVLLINDCFWPSLGRLQTPIRPTVMNQHHA